MRTSPTANLVQPPPDRLFYVESSLPPGLTIPEYRRGRSRRATRWAWLRQRR